MNPTIHLFESRALSLTAFILILLFGTAAVRGQNAQAVAKKAFSSTVLLVMEDANGQPVSLGSGFLISDGRVASNLHVVEGAARGYVKLIGQKEKHNIEGITAVDSARDLVILKVPDILKGALPLGDSDTLQVGESVYAVGNPKGLEGTFSQGIVSSIRTIGADKLLQITAPISPGSSGGPVLNAQSEVVGVSVATFKGGQNLNFAIPSNYLTTLHRTQQAAKPLAQAKPKRSKQSILAGLGGRSTDGLEGGQLQWSWRYHGPLAGPYSFSIRNKLREPVTDVVCLIVFNDRSGKPIDVDQVAYRDIIPAGLARRIEGEVHQSVQELTTRHNSQTPTTTIEFRVLNFRIAE